MLQWYFILFFSRDHVLTMLHLAPIFFGGKLGIFLGGGAGGGSVYPSNTLDRTLSPRLSTVRKVSVLVENDNRKTWGRGCVVFVDQYKMTQNFTCFTVARTARIRLGGGHLLFGEYL